MDKNLNDIEKIFYDSLKDITEEPSSYIWQSLKEDLDAEIILPGRNRYYWTKKAGICMLLLSLSQPLYHPVRIPDRMSFSQPATQQKISDDKHVKIAKVNSVNSSSLLSLSSNSIEEPYSKTENFYQENNITGKNLQLKISAWQPIPGNGIEFLVNNLKEKRQIFSDQQNEQLAKLKTIANKKFVPFWTFTILVSGDFNRYHLENDVPENINGQVQDSKNQLAGRERPELSFTSGIMAAYQLNKNIAFQTGFTYSLAEISIDPHEIHAVQDEQTTNVSYKLNLSSGFAYVKPGFNPAPVVGDSINTDGSKHELRFFSVPIGFQFKKQIGRISLLPAVGISANYISGARLTTEIIQSSYSEIVQTSRIHGLRRFYLGIQASTGIRYSFSKKLAVDLISSFRYAITPITKNTVVATYPYSFGIGAGITRTF